MQGFGRENDGNRGKFTTSSFLVQKQPSRGVLKKSCSENMQQIHRRTIIPKCDFNKVAIACYTE